MRKIGAVAALCASAVLCVVGFASAESLEIGSTSAVSSKGKVASCPAGLLFTPSHQSSNWSAARKHLVPRGAHALRLCRYSPMLSPRSTALIRDRRAIDRLTPEFNALPPLGLQTDCPVPHALPMIVAVFYYPRGRYRVRVEMSLVGCMQVGNGYVATKTLNGAAGSSLLQDIGQFVRRSGQICVYECSSRRR